MSLALSKPLAPLVSAALAAGLRTTASGTLSLTEASPSPGVLARSVLPTAQEPSLPHDPRSEAKAAQIPLSPGMPPLLQESTMQVLTLPHAPATQSSSRESSPRAPVLSYQGPRAIYEKYVAAREDWYAAQPRGSVKTNQLYRKAINCHNSPQTLITLGVVTISRWAGAVKHQQAPEIGQGRR